MTSRGTKFWNSGAIPLIAPDILGDIITEISDIGIVIDSAGTVLSLLINPAFGATGNLDELVGKDVRSSFTVESTPKFDERLAAFLKRKGDVRPLELNHIDKTGKTELPVRYSFHWIGPEGAILMLGRDLRPIAEMQQQLVDAQLALERDFEAQREYETRFRVLMDNTSDAVALVSLQSGRITDINPSASSLLGQSRDRLMGARFSGVFADDSQGEILDRLTKHALSQTPDSFVADLSDGVGTVIIHPVAFRVAGERLLMCRITPKQAIETAADLQAENLRNLYVKGPDAIAFALEDGTILSANEGFLDLLGSAHDGGLKGKNIADFLQRGSVDLKVMTENTARSGKMRSYQTKVASEYGAPRNVEIAITTFQAGQDQVFGFVLREVMRSDGKVPNDDGMQSVMELVGRATLKDIVAETTNVVEKMCIETAVELTMNNRVAAAEMLGLSRQSLYVKLRKFGILGRDSED